MDQNEAEVLPIPSKKEITQKISGSKFNLGHKRRRSVTPMRPVPIAPKTNLTRNIQNVELAQSLGVKNEPGFIAIVPRTNQIINDNDRGNKSILKMDQFEILDSFTGLQNSKRIKIANDDVNMHYILLQNQSLDNCNTILIPDGEENISNQSKISNLQDFAIRKNCVDGSGVSQQYNVVDKSNLVNCNAYSISSKIDFSNIEKIPVLTKSEKQDFNLQKNNSLQASLSLAVQNSDINDETKPVISRNTTINTIEKSASFNSASIESFESLSSAKSRSQKPMVIMQQLLSPPNKTTSFKTERVSIPGANKLTPYNIQGTNIDDKILSKHASPPKSNDNFYECKSMSHNTTKLNNDEQETDFLSKKEFPVISSSQVDSVLKAIDMQGVNKGIVSNDIISHSRKQIAYKIANNAGRSLPCSQGAAKLANENTQCVNTLTDPTTKLETNRPTKRFQSEKHTENYSKTVKQLVDTLRCYKCKECSYMTLNEEHIFEHIEKEHMNVSAMKEKPVLKCMGCANTFHFEASLLSHIVHDHQVHESEARVMVQQLFFTPNLAADNHSPKPISQIRITKTQTDQIFIPESSDPLLDNNERAEIFSTFSPTKITSVDAAETGPQVQAQNDVTIENGELQYMQSIDNIPVAIESNLQVVDVRSVPFFNDDDQTFSTKANAQQNQRAKVLENKNVDCSESLNLLELKSSGERNFEFVNFANETHYEGDDYLQEDDTTESRISDSEMEFVTLAAKESTPENTSSETKTVKIKKKGRPKGSRSFSNKPQPVSLKQGYKCEIEDCGVRMLVQENIAYHQKCHVVTTPRNISYQCPECIEFKSSNWNNLAGHLWRSHIIDMELHSCDLCSYKTPSLSNLANQHRGIHGDDRPFLCDNCGKGFKTTKQLRNHRDLHKAKAKEPLKCDECRRDFTNTRLLKLHKDSVHKESKPFTCSSCPYSASTRSALKLHLRRHTGEKPFACEQCSYSTGDHNSLRRHKLRHLGLKPYSCPYCSYACIQSSTYKVHLKNKHPGLDHDLMFSCQYCTYKSIKKENLLTHMAKHEQVLSNKSRAGPGSLILVE